MTAWRARMNRTGVLLGGLFLAAAILVLYAGRDRTFHYDEWTHVTTRREWTPNVFLEPLNEHLSLLPIAAFKLLFETVGLGTYWPYRATLLVAHLTTAALLFALVRRRAGERLALAAAALFVFLGSAWDALLVPANLGFVGSIGAGLAMLLALQRRDVTGDLAVSAALAASLASSIVGFAFAAVAIVEGATGPRLRSRLLAVALPLAAYGLWFAAFGRTEIEGGGSLRDNVSSVPRYVADAAAGAIGGLGGLSLKWGWFLAAIGVLAGAVAVARGAPVSVRLVSLATGALTFWILTALGRAHLGEPAASRYVYVGAAFVLLIGIELARGVELRGRWLATASVLVLAAIVSNALRLQDGARFLRGWSHFVSAELAAVELGGRAVASDFIPDPHRAPTLRAGPYLDAVEDHGSPADSLATLRGRLEAERWAADAVLVNGLGIEPRMETAFDPGQSRPAVDDADGSVSPSGAGCLVFEPAGAQSFLDLSVDHGELWFTSEQTSAIPLHIRLFAVTFPPTLWAIGNGKSWAITLPNRDVPERWRLRLASVRAPLTVCLAKGSAG